MHSKQYVHVYYGKIKQAVIPLTSILYAKITLPQKSFFKFSFKLQAFHFRSSNMSQILTIVYCAHCVIRAHMQRFNHQ